MKAAGCRRVQTEHPWDRTWNEAPTTPTSVPRFHSTKTPTPVA